MHRARTALVVVAAVMAAVSASVAPVANASTPPPGWSASTAIPGTDGMVNPVAATAPNGTNVIVSFATESGSTAEIDARVRLAGTAKWKLITATVADQPSAQGLQLAAAPDGHFWLAWTTYTNFVFPEVTVTELNPMSGRWTKPVQVFHDNGFGHADPEFAIAADGTVGLAVSAQPSTETDPPVYRVEIAVLRPGGSWQTRFMTPADDFASDQSIAVSPSGYFAVSWIQGYEAGTVMAATHRPGPSGPWHTATLSVASDSQRAHLAIGPHGTVAVAWSAPQSSFSAERLSTTTIGTGTPVWTRRDLVTSVTAGLDAYPVVYSNGDVTVVWTEGPTNNPVVWTSTLAGDSLTTPVQLSPVGNPSDPAALTLQPDGRAALLYQRFGGTPDSEGMSYLTFNHGVMSPTLILTDTTDGPNDGELLGIDAASQSDILWSYGTYPQTNFQMMTNRIGRPLLMTSASSGRAVARARITGHPRVGRKLTCVTGFWVEASTVHYSWMRNGRKIAHRTSRKYRVAHADLHKKLSCAATAVNSAGGHRTVKSKKHRIS